MKRTKLINLKVTDDEYESIHRSAVVHANGNISSWLRTRGVVEVDPTDPRLQFEADDESESNIVG